jgi:hypothetical protein
VGAVFLWAGTGEPAGPLASKGLFPTLARVRPKRPLELALSGIMCSLLPVIFLRALRRTPRGDNAKSFSRFFFVLFARALRLWLERYA